MNQVQLDCVLRLCTERKVACRCSLYQWRDCTEFEELCCNSAQNRAVSLSLLQSINQSMSLSVYLSNLSSACISSFCLFYSMILYLSIFTFFDVCSFTFPCSLLLYHKQCVSHRSRLHLATFQGHSAVCYPSQPPPTPNTRSQCKQNAVLSSSTNKEGTTVQPPNCCLSPSPLSASH